MTDRAPPKPLIEVLARRLCSTVESKHDNLTAYLALGYGSREEFIDAAWPNYKPLAQAAIDLITDRALKPYIRLVDVMMAMGMVKAEQNVTGEQLAEFGSALSGAVSARQELAGTLLTECEGYQQPETQPLDNPRG